MKKFIGIFISILIPNLFGLLGNLLGNSKMGFQNIIKPNFTPPGYIFPIVWIILFTLMGISSYLIYKSNNLEKDKALIIYIIQLILNSLWTLFFFNFKWYFFSFLWILLIIFFVILMIREFSSINKKAALLQIPYLLWLIFAAILNLQVFLLN